MAVTRAGQALWCAGCGFARACDGCIAADIRSGARARVAIVHYCTCTPTEPVAHHLPECPVAVPERDGLDVLPPPLWRRVEEPEWQKDHDGQWILKGTRTWLVLVEARLPCEVIVLDTETTGLADSDRVCELAMARVELATGRVLEERTQLVDPGRPNGGAGINGISPAMLRGKPRLIDIWPAARAFIGCLPVLAHNAGFDRKMLARECSDADALDWRDTKPWSARLLPGATSTKLQELARYLKLSASEAHRALGDVRTLAAVVTRLYAMSGEIPAAAHAPATPRKPVLTHLNSLFAGAS